MIGLRQVVIDARVEPVDALIGLAARRQHQDRHRRARIPHAAAHLETGDPWEEDVENHQVRVVDGDVFERGAAISRRVDRERMFTQSFGEDGCRLPFVFDQQDSHVGLSALPRSGGLPGV
jgi:hypothetical protein